MTQQLVLQAPRTEQSPHPEVDSFELHGTTLSFAGVPLPSMPDDVAEHEVVVRVDSFAVNYRDRALTWDKAVRLADAGRPGQWAPFGSEFCGTVVAVGTDNHNDLLGARVIGRNDFDPDGHMPQGVATNGASRGYLTFPADRVIVPPESLTDSQACTFGLAAQTAAGMLRRGEVQRGSRVLVTGGNSHTSRFIAQLAAHRGADVTVTSRGSSTWDHIPSIAHWRSMEELAAIRPINDSRFDAILDPFIDMYAGLTMPFLKKDGIYVTCGFANQIPSETGDSPLRDVIIPAMVRCARIEVNAIGIASDLEDAVAAFADSGLKSPPTQTFELANAPDFLRASFGLASAEGRPVFSYRATGEGGA